LLEGEGRGGKSAAVERSVAAADALAGWLGTSRAQGGSVGRWSLWVKVPWKVGGGWWRWGRSLGRGCCIDWGGSGVEDLGLVHAKARAFDVDHDGVMHETVNDGRGDHGVAQIVAELLEIDVGGDECRSLAIAAVDDLEEEGGVAGVVLFEPIEAQFVNEQKIGRGIQFELLGEALVGEAREQVGEHVSGGGVAAAIELLAADEKKGFGQMALAGAGVASEDKPLLSGYEVQGGQLEDMGLVEAGLEVEVEIGEKLTFDEARLLDATFDAALGAGVGLDGEQPFQELGGRQSVVSRVGELLVKDLPDLAQLQREEVVLDPGQGLGGGLHAPFPPLAAGRARRTPPEAAA